jgi:hypothetical protein
MISIPRKYFHPEVIEAKLLETYAKIKDITDNIDGYKFNRENISKALLKDDCSPERREELNKTLKEVQENLVRSIEQIPYWTNKADLWESIKVSDEDVVFDDIDEVEALCE